MYLTDQRLSFKYLSLEFCMRCIAIAGAESSFDFFKSTRRELIVACNNKD